jgi:hypothetical protein
VFTVICCERPSIIVEHPVADTAASTAAIAKDNLLFIGSPKPRKSRQISLATGDSNRHVSNGAMAFTLAGWTYATAPIV